MNDKVDKFIRKEIKEGLFKLNDDCFMLFKRMYSYNNLSASIDEAVDGMEETKLEWALTQVERSLNNPKLLKLDTSGKCLC